MADAPLPPDPDIIETSAERAARHKLKILPSGSWVELKDTGPFLAPFKPRFGLDWNADRDPDEAHRQQLRREVAAYCAEKLGPPRPV